MGPRYEIAVGLQRGHKTIKNKATPRPASRKGVSFPSVSETNFELVSSLIDKLKGGLDRDVN